MINYLLKVVEGIRTKKNNSAPALREELRGGRHMKEGGHLLSRIALQYHRRRRA